MSERLDLSDTKNQTLEVPVSPFLWSGSGGKGSPRL